MDMMYIGVLIITLSVTVWVIYKVISRSNKRKTYGSLLLCVRDQTYISDIGWGVGYVILGIILLIKGLPNENLTFSPYTYLMFFCIYSVTYFVRASFKVEIRQLGMLSRDSDWSWEDVENCYSKPVKNSTVVTFEFKNSKVKSKNISVDKKHELEVESQLKNLL